MKITMAAHGKAMTLDEMRAFLEDCDRNDIPGNAVITARSNVFPLGTFREVSAETPRRGKS